LVWGDNDGKTLKSPLGAEGLPYVLTAFDVLGVVKSIDDLAQGVAWRPEPGARVDT